MTALVVFSLLASVPAPPECEAPPTRDVAPLKAFAQKSGTLSVGLDSVATWCFDSSGSWTGGQRSEGKKPKPIDPNAPPVGDCARALASCDEAKTALSDELAKVLTDTLADLDRPYRGQKYVARRTGLSERPSTAVNCRERSRPELFAQAQARMDLARLASAAQNEYANYKTWLYARGLECAQQVRAGRVDTTRVSVSLDAPATSTAGGGAAGGKSAVAAAGAGGAGGGSTGGGGAAVAGTTTSGAAPSPSVKGGSGQVAGAPTSGSGGGAGTAVAAGVAGTSGSSPGSTTAATAQGTSGAGASPGTAGPPTNAGVAAGAGAGSSSGHAGGAGVAPTTAAQGTSGSGASPPVTSGPPTNAGVAAVAGAGSSNGTAGGAGVAPTPTARGPGTGAGTASTGSGAGATVASAPSSTVGASNRPDGSMTGLVAAAGAVAPGSGAGASTPPPGTPSLSSTLITPVAAPPGSAPASGPEAMLETWRGLAAQRGKMELDRDYTLGFLASRELRDCRCQRSSPAGIVARLMNNDGVAQLEADQQRAMACELCLQNAFAAWKARIGKQCPLLMDLSPYELEVLQKSDDGNGIPPRCWEEVVSRRGLDGGVLLATAPVTTTRSASAPVAVPVPAVDAGVKAAPPVAAAVAPTGMPKFEPSSPLADGFYRPNEPAPIPLREDGRLYVRLFMSSTCAADVLPGPLLARTGDLLLIPYGASQLSLRSPCGGLAEVYWGKEPTPRVSEVFGRNQPLHLQFKPQ
ncbi:MAG: hypothetical protein MUC96_02675 [Myxococcaceae bacterium]|nr:hypothetical protein [Myxococcaceae bacterium]